MNEQNEAMRSLTENATAAEATKLLESLRWREDIVIANHDGERVWLKPLVVDGKRIGITDCCFEEAPCAHHIEIAKLRASPEPAKEPA